MTDWQRTIVAASVLAALCGHSAVAAEPKLIGDTTIVVDSLTGAARCQIHLWSDAATPPISLSAVVNSAKPSNLSVLLDTNAAGTGGKTINLPLPAGDTAVWIIVADAKDPGDTSVDLADKDTKIGTIKIRRLSFNVKLDGPAPDKADNLPLLQDIETRIGLKNDDPVDYALDWQLFLDGGVACSGTMAPVKANSQTSLICNSHSIPFRFRHLLKDETVTGSLTIADKGFSKKFPITASAYYWGDGLRHTIRYTIVFVVLLCGGIFSLVLNQTVPNRMQKLDLQEQRLALAKATEDLSARLDSRLGVLVRLELTKMRDLLKSRSTVFPDYAGVAKTGRRGVDQTRSADQTASTDGLDP